MSDDNEHRIGAFLDAVWREVERVDAKLGADQDAPNGDGTRTCNANMMRGAQYIATIAEAAKSWQWLDILREEFFEVSAEVDTTKLQAELVQVAAVCCRWWRAIGRRT